MRVARDEFFNCAKDKVKGCFKKIDPGKIKECLLKYRKLLSRCATGLVVDETQCVAEYAACLEVCTDCDI
jgi:hypothetical protein